MTIRMLLLALLGLVTSFLPFVSTPARAQEGPALEKLVRLVDQSGYTPITKHAPNVWSIEFRGKVMPRIVVIVSGGGRDDEVFTVIGVVIATQNRLPSGAEFARSMLKINHRLDYVKTLLDSDGDLVVRTELRLRNMDGDDFRSIIDQMVKASDEVYREMRPFLRN
ncbi:MAG: YbjN domain-containing protein [Betaproteobacteria bacterium]|nr:YbjN domain-containing protein [Betaproteobacteria bacterium]